MLLTWWLPASGVEVTAGTPRLPSPCSPRGLGLPGPGTGLWDHSGGGAVSLVPTDRDGLSAGRQWVWWWPPLPGWGPGLGVLTGTQSRRRCPAGTGRASALVPVRVVRVRGCPGHESLQLPGCQSRGQRRVARVHACPSGCWAPRSGAVLCPGRGRGAPGLPSFHEHSQTPVKSRVSHEHPSTHRPTRSCHVFSCACFVTYLSSPLPPIYLF